MLKKLAFLAILVVLVAAAAASAASLTVDGGAIQYGEDIDLVCDPDGIKVLGWGYEQDDHSVGNVQFVQISSACAGKGMVTQVFAGGTKLVSHYALLPVDLDNNTIVTVPFPRTNAELITGLNVTIINAKP